MSFKETVNADIKNVFINESDFAEKINLDGLELLGVISDVSGKDSDYSESFSNYLDTYRTSKIIYVTKSDLKKIYKPQDMIVLNNKNYVCTKIDDETGILGIHLGVNDR